MRVINYINVSLQIWGCVISAIVLICLSLGRRPRTRDGTLYLYILLLNMGAMFFDAAALLLRGHQGTLYWFGVRGANFAAFACNYLMLAVFLHYLTAYIGARTRVSPVPLRVTRAVCVLSLVLLAVNLFVPVIYGFDGMNLYYRAPLFWISQVSGVVGMGMGAALIVRGRRALEPQERAALWSYILLPLAALIIQTFVYGLALLNLASTIALVLVFLFLQAEQSRRLANQENELTQDRIDIMLSQIQPHFLFNALNAISYLCEIDPMSAQKSVNDFSTYLRGNLDSLKREKPIPFDKEMEHVRSYLSLEKVRFEEQLEICYDLQAGGFMLPALTVQPLVENAVRYGVGKKPGGGTVTVASRQYPDRFEVVISDDGVGYDPNAVQEDGRTRVGVDNVRSRLKKMCRGALHIESRPGEGTTATITIPREAGRI